VVPAVKVLVAVLVASSSVTICESGSVVCAAIARRLFLTIGLFKRVSFCIAFSVEDEVMKAPATIGAGAVTEVACEEGAPLEEPPWEPGLLSIGSVEVGVHVCVVVIRE